MATIIYLDVDDEITSAAARIRNASETKIALVLPPGSRLATSRINFRLLAREALERNRVLSIVAADPAARAIAGSAGLPVHASVGEFEAATAPPSEPPTAPPSGPPDAPPSGPPDAPPPPQVEPESPAEAPAPKRSRRRAGSAAIAGGAVVGGAVAGAAAGSGAVAGEAGVAASDAAGVAGRVPAEQLSAELVTPPAATPPAATPPAATPRPVAGTPPPDLPPPSPPPSETRARSGAATIPIMPTTRARPGLPGGLVAALGALLVAVLIVLVAGYLVLPQATVVVTPVAVPVGPVKFTVRADPDAASVDPVGGVIPATRLSKDFAASGEFPATGKRVVQTKAKGTVTFTSRNTATAVQVPAGTQVSTASGVVFQTTQVVVVPKATFIPPTPGVADVPVEALVSGKSGNVRAGAIRRVSSTIQARLVNSDDPVNNAAPTSGGKREEFTKVQQKDIDAAMATLTNDLSTQFDAWTAAPSDLPAGATAFPATGHLGAPVPSVDPATLIDVEEATFQLGATATGTVVAVDSSQVDQVAAERIAGNVPANHALQPGSIKSGHDGGQADGDLIDFGVTATAAAVPVLDAGALRDEIKGKSVDEARKLLERYGTVTIATWPGFVSSIPTLDFRLDLSVAGGSGAVESPRPSEAAAPSGSAP